MDLNNVINRYETNFGLNENDIEFYYFDFLPSGDLFDK